MIRAVADRGYAPVKGLLEEVGNMMILTGKTLVSAVRPPYPYGPEFVGQFMFALRLCWFPLLISTIAFGYEAPGLQAANFLVLFGAIDRLGGFFVLAVHNVSGKTLPDVAVTICNVTCAYPAPRGEGTSAAAFSENLQMAGLAHPSRPVWVVDNPPGPCNSGCSANSSSGGGGPGGAVTAYSNTWALGPLRPGQTAKFDWSVTAVAPGLHVVAWEVAAGLNGKAKAVLADGSLPNGRFTVTIHTAPAQTYVNNNGQIVTTSSSAP